MIVETLTEDEANAIEKLRSLIDSDNWLSGEEIVNRIEEAKRRRMDIGPVIAQDGF